MEKRLLCIVGSMNVGGAETFLMKIYRVLDKTRFQMDFAVATNTEGVYDKEIVSLGGRIYHITPKSSGIIKNYNSIKHIVKEKKYKYVLRTSQHSLSALELLAAKSGGAKIRVFRSSNSNTTTGSNKQLILHNICKFMPMLFANIRIAPSTKAAEFMFGKDCIKKGKALLVHNGIDIADYHFSIANRNAVRKELKIQNDQFVIGHIGRFNQQKNHFFLISIFLEVLKIKPDAVLVLVGDGELQGDVKAKIVECRIEDKVIFTGIRSDVSSLLSAFDVFVFPSLYEGMPNTVIEAQANGLPCVIADTITKEADITGLVTYLPLNIPAEEWAERAIAVSSSVHKDISKEFKDAGYDIESVAKTFTNLVFGKQ